MHLRYTGTVGHVKQLRRRPLLPGAYAFRIAADAVWEHGARFRLPPTLAPDLRFLWFDMLLHGTQFLTFRIKALGETPSWAHYASPLCECQTRIVLPLTAGQLAGATELLVGVGRKRPGSADVEITAPTLTSAAPPYLADPLLPRGPLLDELGRSTPLIPAAARESAAALVSRLRQHAQRLVRQPAMAGRSRWGGWQKRRLAGTGFFRTHHDGRRWWLVDPDGFLFWSSGLDCVDPLIDHETKLETRWQNLRRAHSF